MTVARPLPFSRVAIVMHSGWKFLFQRWHQLAVQFRRAGVEVVVFEVSGIRSAVHNLVSRGVSAEQDRSADHIFTAWYPYKWAQRVPPLELALQPAMEASFRLFARRWINPDTLVWLEGINQLLPPKLLLDVPHHAIAVDICDDFGGFFPDDPNMQARIAAWEHGTAVGADLVVASAERLRARLSRKNERTVLVRNGVSAAFLAAGEQAAREARTPARERLVIGYQGAFAEWLDWELFEAVVDALPEAEFRLMGRVFPNVAVRMERLCRRPNVVNVGLLPHERLAASLAELDVGLIPFRINELTRATDPIKLYEYLGAGVPIVATPMPEVVARTEAGLVATAPDVDGTIAAIRAIASTRRDPAALERRFAVARENTWEARFEQILEALVPGPRA